VFRLREFAQRLRCSAAGRRSEGLEQVLHAARADWQESLDADLNFPQALGKLFAFIRYVNRALNRGELDGQQVRQVQSFLEQANAVLDVIDFAPEAADAELDRLVAEREQARQARDFARADALRHELIARGVSVRDTPDGPVWTRIARQSAGEV
jgi:cysteinyl-tRNA synthetase